MTMEDIDHREPISGGIIAGSVIAWLWGAMGLCGGLLGLAGTLFMKQMAQAGGGLPGGKPGDLEMFKDPVVGTWMLVGNVVGCLLAMALIIAGVGLILRQPWGRILGLVYVAGSGLQVASGIVMTFLYTYPNSMKAIEAATNANERQAAQFGAYVGLGGAAFGFAFTMAVLTAIGVFLNLKHVKQQLGLIRPADELIDP